MAAKYKFVTTNRLRISIFVKFRLVVTIKYEHFHISIIKQASVVGHLRYFQRTFQSGGHFEIQMTAEDWRENNWRPTFICKQYIQSKYGGQFEVEK